MNEEFVAKDEDQVSGELADDNLSEAEAEQPSPSRPAYLWPVLVAVGLLVIAVAGVFLDRQVWGATMFAILTLLTNELVRCGKVDLNQVW